MGQKAEKGCHITYTEAEKEMRIYKTIIITCKGSRTLDEAGCAEVQGINSIIGGQQEGRG